MALSVAACNKTKTAKGFLAPLPWASGRGVFFFLKKHQKPVDGSLAIGIHSGSRF